MPKTPLIVGIIFIICVFIAWWINSASIENAKKRLPIINPVDVNPELVDETMQRSGQGHTIRYFELKNQLGENVTGKELDGKIYVADFFFTNCGGICPRMTKQLTRVQEAFKDNADVRILSFSVTPERDSVGVLKRYADKFGVDHSKWWFLTGPKTEIYDMARKSYFILRKANQGEDDGSGGDFIHTENFVLIDGKRRIRGYYSGIRPSSVDSLITDMEQLLKE